MRFCHTLSWKGLNVWTLRPLLLGMVVAHTTPSSLDTVASWLAGWPDLA